MDICNSNLPKCGSSRTVSCLLTTLAFTGLCLLFSFPIQRAYGQRLDSFEGGASRWIFVDSDCQAQLVGQEISAVMPHGGRTCEMLEIACGTGSMAFVAYPIEPCLILNEFQPETWIRASTGRIQLGVRIVFPGAEHPITGARLTSILWGDFYTDTGQWQKLRVDGLESKLNTEKINLRARFGPELDIDSVLIDCLVLNCYSGPGRYRIQIDDLNLRGLIPMTATGQSLPENWRQLWRWRYEVNKPTADQRFWDRPNRPPTWLHYQRESLAWVKSIGFTGLIANQLPSESQLAQIRDAELFLICPPPAHNLTLDPRVAGVVKGWFAGAALDARQAQLARDAAKRIVELPDALRRPLVGEALEQYWMFSRIADQVILPYPAPLTSGGTRDKLAWVASQLEKTSKRGDGWVSLELAPNPALVDQIRTANSFITPDKEFASTQANPLGLRYQTANAVLAGAKGFVFRGFKPLELNGGGESSLVAALRWIHSDLQLWGPWILGGQAAAPPQLSREDFSARAWIASQSRLVLAVATPENGQHCVPPTATQPLIITLAGTTAPEQVLRLTRGRLERIDVEATAAGLKWSVAEPAPIETFVVTANPLVLDFVRKQIGTRADGLAADHLEIISFNLSHAASTLAARFPLALEIFSGPSIGQFDRSSLVAAGREPSAATEQNSGQLQFAQLMRAQRQLDQGYQALQAGQTTAAFSLASQASETVQSLLFDAHQAAVSNLASPQSSPFVVGPTTLHYHWLLADACARSDWRTLELPGTQLLAPDQMERLGWTLEQRSIESVETQVEFVPARVNSQAGLRLAAYRSSIGGGSTASGQIEGGYEGATTRVRSAAAQVREGQLVRVAAKAKILRAPATSDSGVLVYDNQAGPSLGQLVRGRTGETVEIEMYRFIVETGEFRILVECRGECDIVLHSPVVSVIEPAANRQTYLTFPTE